MTMPMNLHAQYITNTNANKISVTLPIVEDNIIIILSIDSKRKERLYWNG